MPGEESYDSFGHGSGFAGIIAGIAPGKELTSVKVLGENNAGTGDVLIAGIRWALDQNIKLINILVVAKRNFGEIGYPAMFS